MTRLLKTIFPVKRYNTAESWLLLALRVVFGTLIITHGIAKWANFDALAASFPDPIGIGSRMSLMLAIFGELFCAAGVIVGLCYRLALVPLIFTMGVALFVVHAHDPFATKELAIIYLCVFVVLFIAGSGRFAIDRFIARQLRKNSKL